MSTMATTKDSSNLWNVAVDPSTTAKTLTLSTANTCVDRDIEVTINKPSDSVAQSICGTGVVGSTDGSVTGSNVTLSSNNVSGVSITGSGKGIISTSGYLSSGTTASSSSSVTKYITGVTIETPSSGTRTFSITVPDGTSDTMTFVFTVDANANTYVVEQ